MSTRNYLVGRADVGRPLADWLRARLGLPRDAVLPLVRKGLVRLNGSPCLDPARRLRRGQRVEVRPPRPAGGGHAPRQHPSRGHPRSDAPPVAPDYRGPAPVVRYADEHVVVVDKPAGLTTVRSKEDTAEFGRRARRFLPPTLADLLPGLLARGRPDKLPIVRAVHRLDKDTSGLVVFARTPAAVKHLGGQFREHASERVYLAVVRGRARDARIESHFVPDRGDGRRGSGGEPGRGQRAVTEVRVVEELGEFSVVECRLETGRTHQVRIHLGEAGTPLCGERVYDRPPHGRPLPDRSGAERVALHAAVLAFDHPATGKRMRWTAPQPKDIAHLLRRLRRPPRREAERAGLP